MQNKLPKVATAEYFSNFTSCVPTFLFNFFHMTAMWPDEEGMEEITQERKVVIEESLGRKCHLLHKTCGML